MTDYSEATLATKEKLAADLRLVTDDAEELLQITSSQTCDKVTELRTRVGENLRVARAKLTEADAAIRDKAREAARATDDYVHENPWRSIGIAAGAGENIFYADVENGQWIEEDLGYTLLAAKVGEQIIQRLNYPVHVPKILTWQQIEPGISDKKFGYYQFRQGRDTLLEIYDQNKKYLYTLAEADADEWQILLGNFNALQTVNLEFLGRITASLSLNDF